MVTLAARARITKQSAAFLVDQLERAGYVVRGADPRDGRAKLVRLSPVGRAIGDAADAEVARVLAEWEDHLGPSRMRDLEETMARLREITDPWGLTCTDESRADPARLTHAKATAARSGGRRLVVGLEEEAAGWRPISRIA